MIADGDDAPAALAPGEMREQLLAVLVAGYETTAAMMAWALHAVARDSGTRRRCADGGYASLVIAETLRLRPPTWMFVRVAHRADRLPSGAAIPAGAKIYLSQYVSHRQPAIFPDPERFDPERFAGARTVPPFAYFPFGGGPRMCFGEGLARLLGVTLLETLAPAVDLRLVSNRQPRALPGLTLQIKGPVAVAVGAASD
jgi:cytochrome P450